MPRYYGRISNHLRYPARRIASELPHYRSYRRGITARYNAFVRRRRGNMMYKVFAALRMNASRRRLARARRARVRRWYERRYVRHPYVQRVPVAGVEFPELRVPGPIVEDDDDDIDELPPLASSSVSNPGGNYEALAEMGSRATSGFSQFNEPSIVASGRFSARSNDIAPAPVRLPAGPQGTLTASTQSTLERPSAISSIASRLRSSLLRSAFSSPRPSLLNESSQRLRREFLAGPSSGNITFLRNRSEPLRLTDK